MPRTPGAQVATVVRVTAAGPFVELPTALGYELGPCLTVVDDLSKGDRVLVLTMARDADELAILGVLA